MNCPTCKRHIKDPKHVARGKKAYQNFMQKHGYKLNEKGIWKI